MAAGQQPLLRSTAVITAWNAVSRVTGFVRVLAIGAALGATFAGNTFQSSNLVSNIAFDLLAAGLLSAPLVPSFVRLLDTGRQGDVDALAGTLLTLCLGVLGSLTLVGIVAAPLIMRLLTVGVADPLIRHQEIRLGTFFLWFFLPQMVIYGVGTVSSALLNASHHFAAAAAAPVANNVVVIATMVGFVVWRGSGVPGLVLPLGPRLLLAVGTTAGVAAMAAVPLVAAHRAGLPLRPRWRPASAELRTVGRVGAWGAVFLGANQLLLAVTLVLANRVPGGVVAYQIAFTFFLLPHGLLAHPLFTALYPRLAADAAAGRWQEFRSQTDAGVRVTLLLVLPAAAALAAVGQPVLRLIRVGAFNRAGAQLTGRVLAGYALGLGGYAVLLLLVRAATAADRASLGATVGAAVAVGGSALMVAAAHFFSGGDRVVAVGVAFSVAMTFGAIALHRLLDRAVPQAGRPRPIGGEAAFAAGLCAAAGLAGWAAASVVGHVGHGGRLAAALAVAAGGALTGGVVLAGYRLGNVRVRPAGGGLGGG